MLSSWKETAEQKQKEAADTYAKTAAENETIRKAAEAARSAAETGSSSSRAVFSNARSTFNGVMDSTSKAFAAFSNDEEKLNRWKDWKASRDVAADKAEEAKAK